jgi:hypothetical protein
MAMPTRRPGAPTRGRGHNDLETKRRRPGCKVRAAAGFTLTLLEHTALPKAPKFVRPAILGSATAPALIPSEPAAP